MAEDIAPKTSMRPRSREQGMGLGLRPKTREEGFAEKVARDEAQRFSEDFGDVEFRYDLDNQLSWNPLARLGFDPKKGKTGKVRDDAFYGAYVPERATNIGKRIEESKDLKDFVGRVQPGDVFMSTTISEAPVWSHEFTHRGIWEVEKKYQEDPQAFIDKYGDETARLLDSLVTSKDRNERATELLDDLSTEMSGVIKNMSQTQDTEFTDRELKGREDLQEILKQGRVSDLGGLDKYTIDDRARLKGFSGILLAAEDILSEKGEPPLAKQEEPSFFQKMFKRLGFNEGGLSMDRQMRTFMAEGGLKDDGMNIDPVSGNEIPPGSMAEEVRDDISAQLSEGEYVVPADVVKYFGVKFFEELRAEAKSGLSNMEQNGRIGGEPVPAGGPRQDMTSVTGGLTQEEMAQLEAIMTSGDASMMTMAQGGIVPQQYGMPIAQPQMSKGYAGGGLEQEMETIESYRTFNPEDYSLGYSFSGQDQITQAVIMLYGPNGEVVSLMLPRDQARYNELLAQGYTTEQEVLKPKTGSEEKEREMGDGGPDSGKTGMDLSNMSTEDIQNAIDAIENNTGLQGKMTNALSNSIVGKAIAALTGKTIAQKALEDYRAELAKRGTPTSTSKSSATTGLSTAAGFESRETDSIGRDISIDGLSMGEDFGGDGRGDTTSAPEGFGLGKDGAGVSTSPSTTGMSMGTETSGDGRGDTSTAPEGFGIGGGEAPGPDAPGPDAPGPDAPGPDAAPAGSTAGGVAADTADDGTVGDIGALMNKGGLATRKTRAKRKPTNMNKGGLASPKSKK